MKKNNYFELNKNKKTHRLAFYLTQEEANYYENSLKTKGFSTVSISKLICMSGKTIRYKEEYLARVLKGQIPIKPEELQALEFYATCKIISNIEYEELLKYKEKFLEIKKQINNAIPKVEILKECKENATN